MWLVPLAASASPYHQRLLLMLELHAAFPTDSARCQEALWPSTAFANTFIFQFLVRGCASPRTDSVAMHYTLKQVTEFSGVTVRDFKTVFSIIYFFIFSPGFHFNIMMLCTVPLGIITHSRTLHAIKIRNFFLPDVMPQMDLWHRTLINIWK